MRDAIFYVIYCDVTDVCDLFRGVGTRGPIIFTQGYRP